MISAEDWAEIRRLHRAEGMPIRAIARKVGFSRATVRRALTSDHPPKYRRAPTGSIVDAVEPEIRELLEIWPDIPATVVAERIGWNRGLSVLRKRVRELRPGYLHAVRASAVADAAGSSAGEGADQEDGQVHVLGEGAGDRAQPCDAQPAVLAVPADDDQVAVVLRGARAQVL